MSVSHEADVTSIIWPKFVEFQKLDWGLSTNSGPEKVTPVPDPDTIRERHASKVDTTKTGEEEKNEKGKRKNRGILSRRAPENFALSPELVQVGVALGLTASGVSFEFAKFRDHEFAKGKSDWPATFRNWLREAAQRQGGGEAAAPVATHPIRRLV